MNYMLHGTGFEVVASEEEKHSTVVCVTNQYQCERLIRAGRILADLTGTNLTVINVSKPDLSENDSRALDYLYHVSKDNDAVMVIYYSGDPYRVLGNYIKSSKASNVVTGQPQQEDSVLPGLWRKFSNTNFFVAEEDGSLRNAQKEMVSIA